MICSHMIKIMFSNKILTTQILITSNQIKELLKYKKTVKIIKIFSITTMGNQVNKIMEVNLIKVHSQYFQYSIEKIPSAMIAAQDKIHF